MIKIEGLENVIERINVLNERFGLKPSPYNKNARNNFAAELKKAQGKIEAESVAPATTTMPTSLPNDTGSLIADAAKKYQLDPRLAAAVAQTESGGNQSAISPAGAVGVMQLMPETAAALGVDPYNKRQNIEGGVKYLKQMLDTFNGDVSKAVAAYNAGAQAVKDYNGIPPYRETQDYVNKVLDIYR